MKVILRAQLVTDWGDCTEVDVAEFSRPARALSADTLGLSLADGKALLERLQQTIAGAQADELCELHRVCRSCHRRNPVKDYRLRKIDTVFGTVRLRSARIISCPCEPPFYLEMPIFPLAPLLPERSTPELQLLQAKLCASLSYRRAAKILREFLPAGAKFNHVTLRNRTLRIGQRIDGASPSISRLASVGTATDWTIAIDGGFVRGIGQGEFKNFEILTGRLASGTTKPYVFAWVGSLVNGAADRVSTLVRARTGQQAVNLCIVTDGANNTQSIRQGLACPATPILDWFHISMKIRHVEQLVQGLRPRTQTEHATKSLLAADLGKIRWCLWHNNSGKLDETLRRILLMCRIVVPETPGLMDALERIDYRIREVLSYVLRNSSEPVAYGHRYRMGQSISSAMAESAVNQVINARMCKLQQMRWSPRGAHLLAQVRCAVLNGDAAEKLKSYNAAIAEHVDSEVQHCLQILQRAA
jgi:hypothetical protein